MSLAQPPRDTLVGVSGTATDVVSQYVEQIITFPTTSWNMVSRNLALADSSMASCFLPFFGPTPNQSNIVKNQDGLVYWPTFGIDQLKIWRAVEGYRVRSAPSNSHTTLSLVGMPLDPQTPISLKKGWNMIGYLPQTPMPMATAMAPILSNITIAKTGTGQVYWPAFGINNIGNMQPGQGYRINILAACTLIYPAR
jgi:hypothetical protein